MPVACRVLVSSRSRTTLGEPCWTSNCGHQLFELSARVHVTHTCGVLDACVVLDEPYLRCIYNLAQPNRLPVTAMKPWVPGLGWRVVDQVMERLLRQRGLARGTWRARSSSHVFCETGAVRRVRARAGAHLRRRRGRATK
jgi:hypothetical protein